MFYMEFPILAYNGDDVKAHWCVNSEMFDISISGYDEVTYFLLVYRFLRFFI